MAIDKMMGILTPTAFPTYPAGFPPELVGRFEHAIGSKVLGNKAASGTQIIEELGPEHIRTGRPILYTSADSVFQIAAHEEVIPIERLYEMCRIARQLCVAPHNLQRVIARPFVGEASGGFTRTQRRKDFPVVPPTNLVDRIGDVAGIGVVPELFDHRGFRELPRTQSNAEHERALVEALETDARFVFANFEDFDMLYGHRNDPAGFGRALERFDHTLTELLPRLCSDDLLLITADHGNDPTSTSTDHSREYVPCCAVGGGIGPGPFGDLEGLDTLGATIASHLAVEGGFSSRGLFDLPLRS